MARKRKVSYWKSKKGYGCWIDGQQRLLAMGPDDQPLGDTFKRALARYEELTSGMTREEQAQADPPLGHVLRAYLKYLEDNSKRSKPTRDLRERYFNNLDGSGLAELRISQINHKVVYDFCKKMRENTGVPKKKAGRPCKWTDGSVRNFLSSLLVALNWAAKSGVITGNPLAGIEVPDGRSRGRDMAWSDELYQTIMDNTSGAFQIVLRAIDNTGARPGDVIKARGADWDDAKGALVYHPNSRRRPDEPSHKTGGKNLERVVRFSGEMLEVVRGLVKQHPEGCLFRPGTKKTKRPKGKWTIADLGTRLWEIKKRLCIKGPLSPYGLRHRFAMRMLAADVSVEALALLMGTSPKMIRDHYGHLADNDDYLRRELEKGQKAASPER